MNLFFSEYVEGGFQNHGVELYNAGAAPVDLSTCVVKVYLDGKSSAVTTAFAAGTVLPPKGVHVACSSYAGSLKSKCQTLDSNLEFDGNDAIELVCGGVTQDVVGQIGVDPGSNGWGAGLTKNTTLIRRCTVTSGRADGSTAFDPTLEWDAYAMDTFDKLGARTCP